MSATFTSSLITCSRCGHTIGEWLGEHVIIRHHGREVIAAGVVSIKCDKCNAVWRPPA